MKAEKTVAGLGEAGPGSTTPATRKTPLGDRRPPQAKAAATRIVIIGGGFAGVKCAAALRSHVMEQLERAETCDDPVQRRWHLSFVVVGGGYSGVSEKAMTQRLQCGWRSFTAGPTSRIQLRGLCAPAVFSVSRS